MMARIRTSGTFGAAFGTLVFAVVLAIAWLGAAPPAHAQDVQAECSFLEIKATNDDSGIDPELKRLKKKLTKPPLSSWNSFKLVARHDKTLTRRKAEDVTLQLGGKLSVLLREKTAGARTRFEVTLAIDSKKGKRVLDTTGNVAAGDYLIVSVDATAESSNLLAVTCR